MRILGIDPGSRITGFGIIRIAENNSLSYITSGCIKLGDAPFPQRLGQIFTNLSQIIKTHQPQVLAIEQVFVHKNVSSALKLGQARGAAICAAADQSLLIHEYSAKQIKQAVVGYGAASKNQVQHMVSSLLALSGKPQADAADALACAICHANTNF